MTLVRDRKKVKNVKHDGILLLIKLSILLVRARHRSMGENACRYGQGDFGNRQLNCNAWSNCGRVPRDVQRAIDDGEVEIPED
jgi:hypothetical protein